MMSEISFERLHLLLGDKAVLELFLSELLGRTIVLRKPPEIAKPWHNIHCIPDIQAAGDDEVISVCVGPCGMGPLMSEMQEMARQCEGVARERHIIMFCREIPYFVNRQSYCKIGPAVLNSTKGEVVPVENGSIYYHVLCCSGNPTAPADIQQLLDVLRGQEPDEGPLLEAMAKVEYQWLWMDNLRRYKKEIFAEEYTSAISDGFSRFDAAEFAAVAEDAFEEAYIKARLERINTFPRGFAKGAVNDMRLLEPMAEYLEVTVEVIKGVLEGRQYTEEDFRRMYGRW